MKHQKTLGIILCIFVLLLSACGSETRSGKAAPTTTTPLLKEGTALEDKQLDLATNAAFPPYEFYAGDKITGIDIDIAQAVADALGYTLKIHDMEFNNIIASIESGKVDGGIAGMTITEERLQNVNFSEPYAKSVQVIVVTKDSPITSIDDLTGVTIGTQLGTTGDIYAKDDFGEENVQSFDKYADAIVALESGRVDCVMVDEETGKNFMAAKESLKILDTAYTEEEYAIALTKNNPALAEEVNEALQALKEQGTLDQIIDKYIQQ